MKSFLLLTCENDNRINNIYRYFNDYKIIGKPTLIFSHLIINNGCQPLYKFKFNNCTTDIIQCMPSVYSLL